MLLLKHMWQNISTHICAANICKIITYLCCTALFLWFPTIKYFSGSIMVTVIVESVFVVWSNSLAHQRGLDLYDGPGKIRDGLDAPPGSQMTFFQEIDVGLFILCIGTGTVSILICYISYSTHLVLLVSLPSKLLIQSNIILWVMICERAMTILLL